MIKTQFYISENSVEYLNSLTYHFKATQPSIKNPIIVTSKLNPDYNFVNYVEGKCNMLARSAGIVVSNYPGATAFNPFMIYGASGFGKTHLAQAIGLLIKEKHPDKIVLYVNANNFQTQFVESIKNNNTNDFIHFYQMIDILILDDIDEFAGKYDTQDAFFQIYNHLLKSGNQLISTCNRPPIELQGIEQRLLTGLKLGLQADLQRPDYKTRLAIIKKKTYNDGIELSDEILEYLAVNISKNIRELESVLISLYAQSTMNRKGITLDLTREIVEKLNSTTKRELTIEYIQKIVCNYYNIPCELIQVKTREREIVRARQVSMFFSKRLTKATLASIGSHLGGKDHTTVLHACKTVYKLIRENEHFSKQIKELEKRLKLLIL